jgi:hypothetical protein
MYEVRFATTWGAFDGAFGGASEGLLIAKINYGVGRTSQTVECDVCGGILVPGGPITVALRQEGNFGVFTDRIDVSIAKATSTACEATRSFLCEPSVPDNTMPAGWRIYSGVVPARAKRLRAHTLKVAGGCYVNIQSVVGSFVSRYESGSCPALVGDGVPLPPNAGMFQLAWAAQGGGITPVVSFVLG